MSQEIRVFVYGTLKPGGLYWPKYCEGKVSKFVPSKCRGLLYSLDAGYPGMVQGDGCWVSGFLLTLNDESALTDIDELEDFKEGRLRSENEYNREWVEIFSLAGKSLGNAWTYFMDMDKIDSLSGVLIERGHWNVNSVGVVDPKKQAV